jgi:ribonuclease I
MTTSRKSERATLYGIKEAQWWRDCFKGEEAKPLEYMLAVAWKKGFEAGDRWRKECQKQNPT